MIRPFQPFDTISTWQSAPDATRYIIRESPRTVPSSAVRLTADRDCAGVHGCGEGGKTGPGRPFCPVGRTLEPNVPDHRIRPVGALFLHRESCGGTGAGAATGTFAGASRSGRGHGFRIPNLRIRGRCPVCCPMHALPGIPEPRGGTGAGVATGTLVRRHLSPARGTVFGYLYEKRYLFRFIRNISFSGSLRAARERMPLLKLLPGGVSPRPGTSGFFIPSPACRFSPARC